MEIDYVEASGNKAIHDERTFGQKAADEFTNAKAIAGCAADSEEALVRAK